MASSHKGRSPLRGGLNNSGARVVRVCNTSSNKNKGNRKYYNRFRHKYLAGKKWYPFLIHKEKRKEYLCLLSDVGYNSKNIYVRITTDGNYMFSSFKGPIELKEYIDKFHQELRCFDEIIIGGPQKPRFDIDLESNEDNNYTTSDLDKIIQVLIDQVIDGILYYLGDISLEKNIRLFTSHGDKKRSVHIVLDGMFHDTYLDAKGFYEDVVKHVNVNLRKYVDHGIYGNNKQLRMMNCCKWESKRIKTLQESFTYRDKVIKCDYGELDNDVTRFISSLITIISGCKRLQSFAKKSLYNKSEDIPEGDAHDAIDMTKKVLKENYKYEFESISGSIIVLRRKSPSFCIICQRIHDSQHPFLFILDKKIYYNCRRHSDNKNYYIGDLSMVVKREKEEIPIEKKERIEKVSENGKTIIFNDGGSFNFRKKNSVIPKEDITEEIIINNNMKEDIIEQDIIERDELPLKIPTLTQPKNIQDRLNSLNKNKVVKRRMPKIDKSTPLSKLVDFNNVEW